MWLYWCSLWVCRAILNSLNTMNTLRPRQNGRHFADDVFKWIFLNENVWISIDISLKLVPKGPIYNIQALAQIMASRRQAIVWTNDGLFCWRTWYASIGLNLTGIPPSRLLQWVRCSVPGMYTIAFLIRHCLKNLEKNEKIISNAQDQLWPDCITPYSLHKHALLTGNRLWYSFGSSRSGNRAIAGIVSGHYNEYMVPLQFNLFSMNSCWGEVATAELLLNQGWILIAPNKYIHDDVIKWKHFPRYCPFVRGIHRWPVNSPHKGQWRGALMFSLICARINFWVNNREAGDLRRHCAHHDVTVINDHVTSRPWVIRSNCF